MRIKSKSREIQSSGIQQSRRAQIRADPIMMEILAGLYENPVKAIVREYGTNMLDGYARLPKGHKIRPPEIHLPNAMDPFIRFVDYGCGMDFDTAFKIFPDFGASTKREDDLESGCYGLGSKTAYCYVGTDQWTVETRKDGKKHTFFMFKDEEGFPNPNFVGTVDTDEPNGVTIQIPVYDQDINKFVQEVRWFSLYFPMDLKVLGGPPSGEEKLSGVSIGDLAVDYIFTGNTEESRWGLRQENAAIKNDSALLNSLGTGIRVIVNHVPYAIPEDRAGSIINSVSNHLVRNIYTDDEPAYSAVRSLLGSGYYTHRSDIIPLDLFFKIGDIELIPSREKIKITEENVEAITNSLTVAVMGVLDNLADLVKPKKANLTAIQYADQIRESITEQASREVVIATKNMASAHWPDRSGDNLVSLVYSAAGDDPKKNKWDEETKISRYRDISFTVYKPDVTKEKTRLNQVAVTGNSLRTSGPTLRGLVPTLDMAISKDLTKDSLVVLTAPDTKGGVPARIRQWVRDRYDEITEDGLQTSRRRAAEISVIHIHLDDYEKFLKKVNLKKLSNNLFGYTVTTSNKLPEARKAPPRSGGPANTTPLRKLSETGSFEPMRANAETQILDKKELCVYMYVNNRTPVAPYDKLPMSAVSSLYLTTKRMLQTINTYLEQQHSPPLPVPVVFLGVPKGRLGIEDRKYIVDFGTYLLMLRKQLSSIFGDVEDTFVSSTVDDFLREQHLTWLAALTYYDSTRKKIFSSMGKKEYQELITLLGTLKEDSVAQKYREMTKVANYWGTWMPDKGEVVTKEHCRLLSALWLQLRVTQLYPLGGKAIDEHELLKEKKDMPDILRAVREAHLLHGNVENKWLDILGKLTKTAKDRFPLYSTLRHQEALFEYEARRAAYYEYAYDGLKDAAVAFKNLRGIKYIITANTTITGGKKTKVKKENDLLSKLITLDPEVAYLNVIE